MEAAVITKYKCVICGRETEWDFDTVDSPICVEFWDQGFEKAEKAAYQRRYRQEHKAEKAAYQRRYRQEHKAELAAHHRRYRQEHKAELAAHQRRYYQEHKAEKARVLELATAP